MNIESEIATIHHRIGEIIGKVLNLIERIGILEDILL